MPTRLPVRRKLLRRYAPKPETARNLIATASEFGLAMIFVTVTVLLIHLTSTKGVHLAAADQARAIDAR